MGVGGQFHASTALTPEFIQHWTDIPTPYAVVTFRKVRRKSRFVQVGIAHARARACVYMYKYICNPASNLLESHRPQHDRLPLPAGNDIRM
jgi:hypothetical protein